MTWDDDDRGPSPRTLTERSAAEASSIVSPRLAKQGSHDSATVSALVAGGYTRGYLAGPEQGQAVVLLETECAAAKLEAPLNCDGGLELDCRGDSWR